MRSLRSLRRILSSSEKCPINSRYNYLDHCCHYFHLVSSCMFGNKINLVACNPQGHDYHEPQKGKASRCRWCQGLPTHDLSKRRTQESLEHRRVMAPFISFSTNEVRPCCVTCSCHLIELCLWLLWRIRPEVIHSTSVDRTEKQFMKKVCISSLRLHI